MYVLEAIENELNAIQAIRNIDEMKIFLSVLLQKPEIRFSRFKNYQQWIADFARFTDYISLLTYLTNVILKAKERKEDGKTFFFKKGTKEQANNLKFETHLYRILASYNKDSNFDALYGEIEDLVNNPKIIFPPKITRKFFKVFLPTMQREKSTYKLMQFLESIYSKINN